MATENDRRDVPDWIWVELARDDVQQYSNGAVHQKAGHKVGLREAAQVRILGDAAEFGLLAVYERPADWKPGMGTECPDGAFVFLPKEAADWPAVGEVRARQMDMAERRESIIRDLLAKGR